MIEDFGEFDDIAQVLQSEGSCGFDSDHLLKINVKGNLRKNITFWRLIGMLLFISSFIEQGYKLPFITFPEPSCFHNNRSALLHAQYVEIPLLSFVSQVELWSARNILQL